MTTAFADSLRSLLTEARADKYQEAARKPISLPEYLAALDLVAALERVMRHLGIEPTL